LGIIETLILILLVLLWSTVAFTGGFFVCLYKFKETEKREREPPKEQTKAMTDSDLNKLKKLQKELQNFMAYDGSVQDDIRIE